VNKAPISGVVVDHPSRLPTPVWLVALAIVGVVFALSACSTDENVGGSLNPTFTEPLTLSSEGGVLEVRLTAAQSTAQLNTVAVPVNNMLLYDYEIVQGAASDGSTSGGNQYPAPTLSVNPGDKLILHVSNGLSGLTIDDYVDPVLNRKGTDVPLTPPPATDIPTNMHTHGLHVSPNGNSDNVLLELPNDATNTFEYQVPADHPQGLYWYHPHRHMLTESQVYRGLAGLLTVGRAGGAIPKVDENDLPVRTMALQHNLVPNRQGGQSQMSYPAWTQMLNTDVPPEGDQLAEGTYRPLLAPTNFTQSTPGTTYKTNWFAGELSAENKRGAFQFIPQNLIDFVGDEPGVSSPADPTLPDHLRDLQITVNGQFQPEITTQPGQTEIWAIGNISSQVYMNIAVRSTATNELQPLRVLSRDGVPEPTVGSGDANDGTTYLLPPASRVAIAVTMPQKGGLQLELPPLAGPDANHTQPLKTAGVLYTSTGDEQPKGQLGSVAVAMENISWLDGFKTSPMQVLATAAALGTSVQSVTFEPGEVLDDQTSFVNTADMKVDNTRTLMIGGGSSPWVSEKDPNGFMYQFQDTTWPTTPVLHPRLNSVEEWQFLNTNNDQHPIHVHVNGFQVTKLVNPVAGTSSGAQPYGYDNFNVPAPLLGPDDAATVPGRMDIRTLFQDYTGTFVTHCHRLDHEDNGLMMTVNVIPEVSTYSVVTPPKGKKSAVVEIRDQADNKVIGKVVPFPNSTTNPSVTMADVDGDQILDLVVGAGEGDEPTVVAYSGAVDGRTGGKPFTTLLTQFQAFDADFRGGVEVAAGIISGSPMASNIIVASGPGRESEVKVYSNSLPGTVGAAPDALASFSPGQGSDGITVAAGLTDPMGRFSIVTAPNTGPAHLKVFSFDLLTSNADADQSVAQPTVLGDPTLVTEFDAFDAAYTGGVSLATGWIAGNEGGAESIVVGQRAGDGLVRTFSSGSNLTGQSEVYIESFEHQMMVSFSPSMTFKPLGSGVSVATTSTTSGAKILVASKVEGAGVVKSFDVTRAPKGAQLRPSQGTQVATTGSKAGTLGGD